jgi:hypothetical protein
VIVVISAISSPVPSPSRSGTSYSITRIYRAWSGSRSSPRRAASISGRRALSLFFFESISTDRYDPSGSSPSTGSRTQELTRHSSAAPVSAAARQLFQV